jgi:galactokinase
MIKTLLQEFHTQFDQEPLIVRSPARINIIGEHTDYNLGFVLPAAIDMEIIFAIAPNQTNHYRFFAHNLDRYLEIPTHSIMRQVGTSAWANYLLGVIQQIQLLGYQVPAFDCIFGGDIPKGAGLSSSAALECGLALAINQTFGLGLDKLQIVKLSQKAENEFVGVKCGIMDQFANTFGRANQVIRLDCRNLSYQYFPLELSDYQLVLLDTGVHHSLASSEYNTRRQQCEEGVHIIKKYLPDIQSLRDIDNAILDAYKDHLPSIIWQRCNFIIKENQRVIDVCKALEMKDIHTVGKKMFEAHHGLQYDYEVSCPELDFLVSFAANDASVIGARMMGGGFGGCTINLIKKEGVESFVQKIKEAYFSYTSISLQTYIVKIVDGTQVINHEL